MNFKKWFLSLFSNNKIYCEYNIGKESFYFYEPRGKIKILSLDNLLKKQNNLLRKQIKDNDEYNFYTYLLKTALGTINKTL